MEYISAKEFLKQPHKVQKVLQQWFIEKFEKSNEFDLFNYNGEDLCYKNILDRNCDFYVEDCIPLLTEGQIRQFIEDKTNCKVDWCLIESEKRGDSYDLTLEKNHKTVKQYQNLCIDLLQAYWKVACQIASKEE